MEHDFDQKSNTDENKFKQSMTPIMRYVEGSYFGDSDIFMNIETKYMGSVEVSGRDATCFSTKNSLLFLMSRKILD